MRWRHEQLTLQMALAAALHHSRDVGPVTYNAQKSQKTARAEATNNALRSQTSSVAGDTEFFSLYEEELGGTRPEVRPQERVQRCTVETDRRQTRSSCRRLMENQLVEVCRLLDVLIPEQAIGSAQNLLFPSISQAPCAFRGADGGTVGWKCRRSYLTPRCTGLWSRTWTFQFLMVVIASAYDCFW